MDTHILAGILGRTHNILWTCCQQKIFYIENNLKKIENPTDGQKFLLERNEQEVEEIKILLCLIERSLFPPCGADQEPEVSESDLEILNFLSRNEGIRKKLEEKIKESQPVA